jgi:ABC-type amino acid transport substrate-binding protein
MLNITRSNGWLRPTLLLLALLLPIPQLSQAQDNLQTVQEIRNRGQLRVASLAEPTYPFSTVKQGHWSGYEVELAKRVADAIGVKLVWDASYRDTAELVSALKQNKTDVVFAHIKRDLATAQQVNYSLPYITLNFVIVTNRLKVIEKKPIDDTLQSISKLPLRIGTLDVSDYRSIAGRRFPNAKVDTFVTLSSLTEALESGKIDAVFCDEVEGRNIFGGNTNRGLYLGYFALPELRSEVVAMVDWPNMHFVSWLNLVLEPVAGKTTIDQLFLNKY